MSIALSRERGQKAEPEVSRAKLVQDVVVTSLDPMFTNPWGVVMGGLWALGRATAHRPCRDGWISVFSPRNTTPFSENVGPTFR